MSAACDDVAAARGDGYSEGSVLEANSLSSWRSSSASCGTVEAATSRSSRRATTLELAGDTTKSTAVRAWVPMR